MQGDKTLNDLIEKYVDYGSEEYIKQLSVLQRSDRKLTALNPFVGIIAYPSPYFLNSQFEYRKLIQAQTVTYIGHMEFLLPPVDSLIDNGLSYTLVTFKLDNYLRQFVQISKGSAQSQGTKFKDFVLNKFPNASKPFAFNRHAFHTLTDIEISGAVYEQTDQPTKFNLVTNGSGAFTPSVRFEFAVSGYQCLIQ